jgi:hypothetical protein
MRSAGNATNRRNAADLGRPPSLYASTSICAVIETTLPAPAMRVGALAGLRLGLLDTTKWNANRLLRKTVARLQWQISFAPVSYYRTESFSKDVNPCVDRDDCW